MEQNGGDERENYLAHYGVVGMRWGVRRYQPYSYTGARRSGRAGKEIGEAAKLGKKAAKAVGKGAKIAGKSVASGVKKYREYRRERKRQDLINRGSSKDLKANRGKLLSEDDVKKAIDRIKDDIILDDLARDVHMKAIKRGKEALNLAKDFLNTGWGIYTTYKQIKGESTNLAIDRAANKNDIDTLKSIRDSGKVDRKTYKELDDLIREKGFDKPLEKAYRDDSVDVLKELAKKAPDKKTKDEINRFVRDAEFKEANKQHRDAIEEAIQTEDVSAFDSLAKYATNDQKERMAEAITRRNKRHTKPKNKDKKNDDDDE